MEQFDFTTQGWECPRCKRVYSPTTMMCIACPQYTQGKTSTGTSGPIVTSVGVGVYGTTTDSTICRLFVPDPESETSKCINCGKPQIDHPLISYT